MSVIGGGLDSSVPHSDIEPHHCLELSCDPSFFAAVALGADLFILRPTAMWLDQPAAAASRDGRSREPAE
jgi:hypothetical protein